MQFFSIIYALILSSIFAFMYIKIYKRYFDFRKYSYFGILLFLFSIYIQFIYSVLFDLNIGYIALLSFITYPLSISLIYKTSFFNTTFLALNAIIKIYIGFVFFSTVYAITSNVQYSVDWISNNNYYHLAQGHSYFLSIGSLLIVDNFLIKNKLKVFFQLKRNLLLIIFIQIILLTNMIWISVTDYNIPYIWYNNVLLLLSLSVDIIYFLLRLFTASSSYYSAFKSHSETLKKQLSIQLEHYKLYEKQMQDFLKFKHDYDKVLNGISNLLVIRDYESIEKILLDSGNELSSLSLNYIKFSNNLILDALLNNYYSRFSQINAKFSSFAYINMPNMSEIKLIKLFYNILENSYEALQNVSPNKRIMTIDSEVVENYIKISFVNSFVKVNLNSNKTSKTDTINHGYGLTIINEIVTEYDGFINKYITTENDVDLYNLEIFLPITN